nr:mating-type switching protein swi10 [Quercus suber]
MTDEIKDSVKAVAPPTALPPSSLDKASTTSHSVGPRTTINPDRASSSSITRTAPKVGGITQPKPQALSNKRTSGASIIVSPRQKGNPILSNIKSLPWEYGDIPADYVVGVTTCALFLSLKYHRLHPEYIYTRIKNLQGKYHLRVVLVMVDIQNHEESLRELSKTSLINNVTLVLCWSAAEGGRYLELFKTYENASPTSIKQHQSTAYSDRMVDFITTPRSINKTDAVALVSQFGTIRTAVNARYEEVGQIAGWGEKKVQRWCASVTEPFRVERTARSGPTETQSQRPTMSSDVTRAEGDGMGTASPADPMSNHPKSVKASEFDQRSPLRIAQQLPTQTDDVDAAEALAEVVIAGPVQPTRRNGSKQSQDMVEEGIPTRKRKLDEDVLSDGIMAALGKLRKDT